MIDFFLKIWNSISNYGVSEKHPEENDLVRWYNRLSFICTIGCLLILGATLYTDFSIAYTIIITFITLLYASTVASNYFGKIYLARYLISVGTPIWVSICYFLIGGFFSQGIAMVASIAITFVAFQKKIKTAYFIMVLHFVLYFASVIYVNEFGPLLGVLDFPYDELIVFLAGLSWIIAVLISFDKERTALLEDLKINNEELIKTTEELERFTYIASHDLKSPLRTIVSFVGLIERNLKRKNYAEVEENLDFVKSGALQMNFLVQDILELSKVNNVLKKERSLFDLNLTFEKAQLNLKDEIAEKNAVIHCQNLPNLFGSQLDFLMLFQNIIQNGIKYNDSVPPKIFISGFEKNDHLHLLFEDNGIGIEEAYYEHIFQFFKRLHTTEKYQGTGLGLGLCKKIIESYDGLIEIDSEVGKGSTFTIILPIKRNMVNSAEEKNHAKV